MVLPLFINHFFNMCISYRVVPVGGYKQEPEQEVLVDLQTPRLTPVPSKASQVHIDPCLGSLLHNCH
jgi:hypothetical protein